MFTKCYFRYYKSSITADGPESAQLGEIAKKYKVNLVTGVVERVNNTLYCTVSAPIIELSLA